MIPVDVYEAFKILEAYFREESSLVFFPTLNDKAYPIIIERLGRGDQKTKIATDYNVSRRTLNRFLDKYKSPGEVNHSDIKEMKEMAKKGVGRRQIADIFCIPVAKLNSLLDGQSL